jgi:hypothetical protein
MSFRPTGEIPEKAISFGRFLANMRDVTEVARNHNNYPETKS